VQLQLAGSSVSPILHLHLSPWHNASVSRLWCGAVLLGAAFFSLMRWWLKKSQSSLSSGLRPSDAYVLRTAIFCLDSPELLLWVNFPCLSLFSSFPLGPRLLGDRARSEYTGSADSGIPLDLVYLILSTLICSKSNHASHDEYVFCIDSPTKKPDRFNSGFVHNLDKYMRPML
jgi:hypothetical protein